MNFKAPALLCFAILLFFGCETNTQQPDPIIENTFDLKGKLPVLGEKKVVDGKTIYHEIPDFSFVNQDSQIVNNATFKDKLYVVDFFFTHCPTICPKVKKNMLKIYDKFENEDQLVILSHTVDQKRDTVGRLKWYADNLEVKTDRWMFVTGDKKSIYEMADEYFIIAKEDTDAPGGFDHSGTIILVDKNKRVRSFCNGLEAEAVDRFITDIDKLLNES